MSLVANTILNKSYNVTFGDYWHYGESMAIISCNGSMSSLVDYRVRLLFNPIEETKKKHWFSKRKVVSKIFKLIDNSEGITYAKRWNLDVTEEELNKSVVQRGDFIFVCDIEALRELFQAIEKSMGTGKNGYSCIMFKFPFYELEMKKGVNNG